jgi:hypothetical protein
MRWLRVSLGLVLAVTSGVVLGYGWAEGDALLSPLGTLTLILGALTALSALLTPRRVDQRPEQASDEEASGAPPLGQMLVNYGLITEADLERALQQHDRKGKRLGRVLVAMGLVTHAQIAEVLEEQLSRRGRGLTEDSEGPGTGGSGAGSPLTFGGIWEGFAEEKAREQGRERLV